jgi:hypothetical protein
VFAYLICRYLIFALFSFPSGKMDEAAPGAATPSKVFFISYRKCNFCTCICCENAILCCSYFSPRLVKNKPGKEIKKQAFILGPASWGANLL